MSATANTLSACPVCGAGDLVLTDEPIALDLRGETCTVSGIMRRRCGKCGEDMLDPGQTDEILRRAAAILRRERGLLTPQEIRELRGDLHLTQEHLEALLGVGPKTVTRWEKGTVFQSATAVMRLLRSDPSLVERLEHIDA